MEQIHILQLLSTYHPIGEEVLNEHAKVTKFDEFNEKEIIEFLSNHHVDGILLRSPARITPAILDACHSVKAISGAAVGLDNIDVEYATKKGIPILHAPKINTVATAEHTVSLILAVAKDIVKFHKETEKGNFNYRDGKYTMELRGKKLGLVGFGAISQEVARIMKYGFQMDVLAYVRRIPKERQLIADDIGVELTMEMEKVFRESDVVSLHIPLNENTKGLIDKHYFELMKEDSILINAARGGVINEADLVETLKTGRVRAAGVDVFKVEPPPSDHPFLTMDQITKTPHMGGVSLEAARNGSWIVATNLIKFLQGEDVPTIVNKEALIARGILK